MQAKYKVGDEVHVPAVADPLTIVAVETCYRFSPNGALWREDELTPYVRPLQVGDRVRWKRKTPVEIICIEGGDAWVKDIECRFTASIVDLEPIREKCDD